MNKIIAINMFLTNAIIIHIIGFITANLHALFNGERLSESLFILLIGIAFFLSALKNIIQDKIIKLQEKLIHDLKGDRSDIN